MKGYNPLSRSFRNAFAGICLAMGERNMKIHLATAIGVVACSCIFNLSRLEWLILLLNIAGVLVAETFNTAIERLADRVCPTYDDAIRGVKDIAAGAVVIMAVCAAISGIIIFIPKFL